MAKVKDAPAPEEQDPNSPVEAPVEEEQSERPLAPASFSFIGDPNDDLSGATEIVVKGVRFTKNKPRLIRDLKLVRFFRRHNHFVEGDNAPVAVKKQELQVEKLRAECEARKIPFDRHWGVGRLERALGQVR